MKYRLKPEVLDAWRVPETTDAPRPDWLMKALRNGTAWAQAMPCLRITVLPSPQAPSEVAVSGDWILHIDGSLKVMTDETFQRLYEPEKPAADRPTDPIAAFNDALAAPRTFVRVYELPPREQMTNGYCFQGPVPIPFGNVDWFEVAISEGRERLTEFIKGKRYYQPHKTYLVLGDHPDFVFTIARTDKYRFA